MARKAALVTGAARRIGLAIAERLAGAGHDVAIHASDATRPEADEAAARLQADGHKAIVIAAELSDPAAAGAHRRSGQSRARSA